MIKLQTNIKKSATLPRHKIGFYALIVIASAAAAVLAFI